MADAMGQVSKVTDSAVATDPIFVLTAARSGSTLLRFILDAHPKLACPPEVGPGPVCLGLARLSRVLWSRDTAHDGEFGPEDAPLDADAAHAIRTIVGAYYSDYLGIRGKRRWCDKSLDNFIFAPLLRQVFPEARFICLYRHCMDVVASGLEASPFGPRGFGFDTYASQFPGNNIATIAAYWRESVGGIRSFQEAHPDICMAVRYEDLVSEPEHTAASIFAFLGEDQVPGITSSCFQVAHDRHGPSDQKIWFTDRIVSHTIGRGTSIPSQAIPGPLLLQINALLESLKYHPADDRWNAAPVGMDPRSDIPHPAQGTVSRYSMPVSGDTADILAALSRRLSGITTADLARICHLWPALAGRTIRLIIDSGDAGAGEIRCHLGEGPAIAAADGTATGREATGAGSAPDRSAAIIGSADTWRSLLDGTANMAVELLACRLRCVDVASMDVICPPEAHAAAHLLGLSRLPPDGESGPGPISSPEYR